MRSSLCYSLSCDLVDECIVWALHLVIVVVLIVVLILARLVGCDSVSGFGRI